VRVAVRRSARRSAQNATAPEGRAAGAPEPRRPLPPPGAAVLGPGPPTAGGGGAPTVGRQPVIPGPAARSVHVRLYACLFCFGREADCLFVIQGIGVIQCDCQID
jgi:hypothetical protein